jgi:RNA polymerase sigma-70 factor (ECF subfamily)
MHLDDVLTELVEHCGDRLLRVAYQLTHDAAAAQDLVQEALLRVYQSVRHRGLAPEGWYAYLRRAVINEYVRTRRLRSTEIVTNSVPGRPAAGCLEDRAASRGLAAMRPLVAAVSAEEEQT